jgi:hypothetical protein
LHVHVYDTRIHTLYIYIYDCYVNKF